MQEQVEKFDLDRVTNIENNIDAFGKKWEIVRKDRATALLIAKPNPYRKDFVCPEEFVGAWTSFDRLQEKVKLYVTRTWDLADEASKPLAKKVDPDIQVKTPIQKAKESVLSLSPEIRKELGLEN